jgi:outer membrane protein assembly factor BamB
MGCLFLLSCSRGPQALPDPVHPTNRPLPPFNVTVVDRAPATAIIRWTEAINTYTGDTVKYKIKINDRIVDSNLIRLTDTLKGLSQDTAYNGRVYAYTRSGDTASAPFRLEQLKGFIFFGDNYNTIYCYDIYSGTRVWRSQPYGNGLFLGMPTIVNNVLYINGTNSGTWAFNAKTGEKIWNNPFSGYPDGSAVNPLWVNGRLYTVMPGAVYALNSSNGAVIWSYPTSENIDANPVIAGNLLITAAISSQTKIIAINAETGLKAWDYNINTAISKNPVVYNDLLIFGGSNGKIYALNNSTGSLVWSKDFSVIYNNFGADFTSPVIYKNLVIVHNGNSGYYGLNAANGAIVWNYPISTPNISSPAIGNDVLYFSADHIATALKAATGALVWEHPFGESVDWPTPIYANNRLYFGHNLTYGYGITVLNASTGAPLLSFANNVYQWGKETIVNNDSTCYLSQSGMVQ